jgi:FkbM family methyltransferase
MYLRQNVNFDSIKPEIYINNLDKTQLTNAIVLDLGANRGDFSKWALDRGATVIAFEPDKDVYIQLVKRLNKFNNFFPINSAVSNKTGFSKFYYHKSKKIDPIGFSVSSSLLAEKPNINNLSFNTVFCIDLGILIKEFPIKLIKIDIEGAEDLIWPAIKQNYRNLEYLLLEIHSTNSKELITEIEMFIEENSLKNKWRTDWI